MSPSPMDHETRSKVTSALRSAASKLIAGTGDPDIDRVVEALKVGDLSAFMPGPSWAPVRKQYAGYVRKNRIPQSAMTMMLRVASKGRLADRRAYNVMKTTTFRLLQKHPDVETVLVEEDRDGDGFNDYRERFWSVKR